MKMSDFFKTLSAVFIIAVCALAQTTEQFQFKVKTTAANETFAIPLSGCIDGSANGKASNVYRLGNAHGRRRNGIFN